MKENIVQIEMAKGAAKSYGWNCAAFCHDRNTTISSVVWSALDSGVSVSNDSSTSTTTQAKITASSETIGSRVKAVITFANGDIDVGYFMVSVIDPRAEANIRSDY